MSATIDVISTRDGAWRRVQVRVVKPAGLTARTKLGYYGPTSGGSTGGS